MQPVMNSNYSMPTDLSSSYVSSMPYSSSMSDFLTSLFNPHASANLEWNRQEQSNLNAFIRQMYADSTKYQRSMSDLRAAGINPIFALDGGMSGQSFSGGSGSSGNTSNGSGLMNLITGLVSLGANIALLKGTGIKKIGFGK